MNNYKIETCIKEAIKGIESFITKTTGKKPEQKEIASALTKYFVLKEITGFVELERQGKS